MGKRERDNDSLGTAPLNEPEVDKVAVGAGVVLVAAARVGETDPDLVVLTMLELVPDEALDFLQLIGLLLPDPGLPETIGTGGFATRPLIAETSSSVTCLGAICRGEAGLDELLLEVAFVARGLFCQARFGTCRGVSPVLGLSIAEDGVDEASLARLGGGVRGSVAVSAVELRELLSPLEVPDLSCCCFKAISCSFLSTSACRSDSSLSLFSSSEIK